MEENNTTSTPTSGKPSYEQLEQGFIQLQQRLMQTEARLGAINLTAMRLDYLFKVLEVAPKLPVDVLNPEFVTQCAKEIEMHMTPTEPAEESDTPETEE